MARDIIYTATSRDIHHGLNLLLPVVQCVLFQFLFPTLLDAWSKEFFLSCEQSSELVVLNHLIEFPFCSGVQFKLDD